MKKILVVDDEKEIRDLLKAKLAQKYSVTAASSGQEALDICKNIHPDLVLLDVAMPAMDGYAVCEKIKKDAQIKDIPVLFLTGKDLDPKGLAERCSSLSADGYISKTTSLRELLDKIIEVIG